MFVLEANISGVNQIIIIWLNCEPGNLLFEGMQKFENVNIFIW